MSNDYNNGRHFDIYNSETIVYYYRKWATAE